MTRTCEEISKVFASNIAGIAGAKAKAASAGMADAGRAA
jgi:hypothetical protein